MDTVSLWQAIFLKGQRFYPESDRKIEVDIAGEITPELLKITKKAL